MRKFFILAGFILVSSLLFAQNKMQMVTYFPVPYVAYNDIEVTQFCEVGLLNQCNMALGPGDPVQNPYTLNVYKSTENGVSGNKLNTGIIDVKSGTLNLNSEGVNNKITGNTLEAGVGTMHNNSEISFEHRLNVSGTNNVPSRSVSSQTNAQIKEIKMFPDRIANNLPGCAEGVTWQRVRIGMSTAGPLDEVFLVCGTPVISQVCKSTKPSTERTCPAGCGKQTRTVSCNVNTGQWDAGPWSGACSNAPETFRNCREGCGTQTRSYSCDGTRWVPTQWTGSCWAPFGGGETRNCRSGCGTETSTSTCDGASWSGNCWSPYCNKSCGCSQCGSQSCESSCDGGYCSGDCWSPYGGGNETQDCGNGGKQSRYCRSTCSGSSCPPSWGPCEGEAPPTPDPTYDCTGSKPSSSETCNTCGTRTRSVTCNTSTGSWKTGSWGSCSKTQAECNTAKTCSGSSSQSCGCNNAGKQTRTCNTSTGQWNDWGACSVSDGVCSAGATETRDCPTGNGTQTRTCNAQCKWDLWSPCSDKTTYKMHRLVTFCNPSLATAQCHPSMGVEGKSCSGPFTCCMVTRPNRDDCPYNPGSDPSRCEQWATENATGVMWECIEN